jgi:Fe(3+) dicitrate transport protein
MLKRLKLFAGLALMLPGLLQAQSAELRGRLLDAQSGEALWNVAVIYGENRGLLSDEDGRFAVKGLPEGPYVLRLRYTGYQTRELRGELQKGQSLDLGDIALQPALNQLAEIRVSASSASFSEGYAGANTYLSPVAMREMRPMGLEDALRSIPGLQVVGDMGLSNRPNLSIRGSWGRRSYKVLLLEDGSFIAPAPYIQPGAYYNPPAERIEAIRVIKGAETLMYGPNNMYGVVNYISRRPPQEPEVRLSLIGGQRGYTSAQASYGGTWNQVGSDVQVQYKRFDGYQDNSTVALFNLHTKFYFELDERQSFYFKLGYQRENNNASLSALTPFTFETDPTQNPFDADQFTSRRYSLDVLHKYAAPAGWSLTTKVYGADFDRDWWRQRTALVHAGDVRAYVGESIFQDRYSYLEGRDFGPDDFVRVGSVVNGREATNNSHWNYTFGGLQEQVEGQWSQGGFQGEWNAGARLHTEVFIDQFIESDSSRWARSGRLTQDRRYDLWSAAIWGKHVLRYRSLTLTPLFRWEHVDTRQRNLVAAANDPNLQGKAPALRNAFGVFLPGLSAEYRLSRSGASPFSVFASTHRGFIAPNDRFAFLIEENGVVRNPSPDDIINMQPEISFNTELGLRGRLFDEVLEAQMAGFRNRIRNFYDAGRGELFRSLGTVNMAGLEASLDLDISRLAGMDRHRLHLTVNGTWLRTRIVSGEMRDADLAGRVRHSQASAQELLDLINSEPGVTAFVRDAEGQEVPVSGPVALADLAGLSSVVFRFGEDGLSDYQAPGTPPLSLYTRLGWRFQNWSAALEYHYNAAQFTDFSNIEAESADGAIGRLPAFYQVDAQLSYTLQGRETEWEFFVAGKNLTNEVFRASRLNRLTSGIFPGGFRQINLGAALVF